MDTVLKENIKKLCDCLSDPIAIMDNNFTCLYSNCPRLICPEKSMMSIFLKKLVLPIKENHITMSCIKGIFYSVRIMPLGEFNVCEFFNQNTLLSLAENTNVYDKLIPIIKSVEYNTAAIWRGYSNLCSKLKKEQHDEDLQCAVGLERYLICLNSVTKNISEYANMLLHTNLTEMYPINLKQLATEIVERCNTILLTSGRYIDIVCDQNEIYIKAEARHTICALVNALQNALLYSPRECVPYFTIYNETDNNQKTVRIQILNDNIMYIDQKHGERFGIDFDHQRLGFGIPIIKRFAEMTGGSFLLEENNGSVRLVVDIPATANPNTEMGVGIVNSSKFIFYKTNIPDIIELKMSEVNERFA